MNVYDFDGTIYRGDSSVDFAIYCFAHKKKCLKKIPTIIKASLLYGGKRIHTKQYKEQFFSFLSVLSEQELNELVRGFWAKNRKKVAQWYIEKKRDEDVIISASPRFLLETVTRELGVKHLIATAMDSKTGCIEGENCKGKEKVRLFRKTFPNQSIDEFFSDSLSDVYMAHIAEKAYYVAGDTLNEWPDSNDIRKTTFIKCIILRYKGIILYGVFGVLTTLINVLVYELCYAYYGVSNIQANVIAWLLAVLFAFITNKIWVFGSKKFNKEIVIHELLSFFGARLVTGLLDICIMWIAVDCMKWNPTLWKIISNIIVIVLNYVASKLVVFKKTQ